MGYRGREEGGRKGGRERSTVAQDRYRGEKMVDERQRKTVVEKE